MLIVAANADTRDVDVDATDTSLSGTVGIKRDLSMASGLKG